MAARGLADVPYRHQGRSRHGVDCVGLVACSLQDVVATVVDDLAYDLSPTLERLWRGLDRNLSRVSEPLDGDVIAFELHSAHCGIVDGAGFWHVLQHRRVMWTAYRGIWRSSHVATFGVG